MVKMLSKAKPLHPSNGKPRPSGPAWDVARLFPDQGCWAESDYLELDTNRLVELSNGKLEVLAMPTRSHQLIVAFLYAALAGFVTVRRLGKTLFAPYRVRLWKGKFREPDIIFVVLQSRGPRDGSGQRRRKEPAQGFGDQAEGIRLGAHSGVLDC